VLLAACIVDGFQGGAGPRQLISIISDLLRSPTKKRSERRKKQRRGTKNKAAKEELDNSCCYVFLMP
jgi:hypothetical protein